MRPNQQHHVRKLQGSPSMYAVSAVMRRGRTTYLKRIQQSFVRSVLRRLQRRKPQRREQSMSLLLVILVMEATLMMKPQWRWSKSNSFPSHSLVSHKQPSTNSQKKEWELNLNKISWQTYQKKTLMSTRVRPLYLSREVVPTRDLRPPLRVRLLRLIQVP